MAGRGASIFWFFVKWFVVPIGLAAIGYFVVGPRIGYKEPTDEPSTTAANDTTSSNANHDGTIGSTHQASRVEPQVEVESREVNPRKRTKPKPKPKVEDKPETNTPPDPSKDPGSVGGTTEPPSGDPVEPTTGGGGDDGAGVGG